MIMPMVKGLRKKCILDIIKYSHEGICTDFFTAHPRTRLTKCSMFAACREDKQCCMQRGEG